MASFDNYFIDPTRDTSEGVIADGGDITAALQEAVNSTDRRVMIPKGHWLLSDTITLPYRIGGTLLGSGITHPPVISESQRGVATTIGWNGADGIPMFIATGEGWEIGNFTLCGKPNIASTRTERPSAGLLIAKNGNTGIGTGTMSIRPLWIEFCDYGVQLSTTGTEGNSDSIIFDLLRCHSCIAAYRSVSEQNVDITIKHLINYGNTYGLQLDGGGELCVQRSISIASGTAFLRLPSSVRTGKYNGNLNFYNTKIDSNVGSDYTLIDSDNEQQLCLLFVGGQYSDDDSVSDPYIKLTGRNSLTMISHASTFNKIVGVESSGYTPSMQMRDCRLWAGSSGPIIEGDLDFRSDNTRFTSNNLRDDIPDKPTFTEMENAILSADYSLTIPSSAIVAVSISGDTTELQLPKADQPRTLSLNVAGIAAQSSNSVGDIDQVRVKINERRTTGTVYNVSSIVRDSGDPETAVSFPTSTGAVNVSLTTADFGVGKLEAGYNYYVIAEVLIDGEWREADKIQRLMFTFDQS